MYFFCLNQIIEEENDDSPWNKVEGETWKLEHVRSSNEDRQQLS